MNANIAIVIVTHNSEAVICGLLESIGAAAQGYTVDVVVVDNGSTDGTVAAVAGRSDCRLIKSENIGYAAGINLGVQHASPEGAVLILNADVRLFPGSISALAKALESPTVGVAAPRVVGADGLLDKSLRREPTVRRELGLAGTGLPMFCELIDDADFYICAQTVDWAMGAALMIDRVCFNALGGWDGSYFLYSEETDFCLRARDIGFETRYVPEALVEHIGGQSGRNAWTYSMKVINRVRLYRRRHHLAASWVYYSVILLKELARSTRARREDSRAAVRCLLRPSTRPREIGCSDRIMPT